MKRGHHAPTLGTTSQGSNVGMSESQPAGDLHTT
jgi:hypothetical protein